MTGLGYDRTPGDMCFNAEAADVSRYGTFTDCPEVAAWNDKQIKDFIRGQRPDLFKALQRVPVSTASLPAPIHLGLGYLSPHERVLIGQGNAMASTEPAASARSSTASVTVQHRPAALYRIRTVELQHKRHIQAHILGGFNMLLQCSHKPGSLLFCSAPCCHEAVGKGEFFITLCSTPSRPDMHYGLRCLEDLMEYQKLSRQSRTVANHYAVDGAADSRPVMPHDLPSNSIENRRLRQERAQEIDDILQEIEKHQNVSVITTESADDEAKVRIHRPNDLEDMKERYKKQRLTKSDQTRETRERRVLRQQEAPPQGIQPDNSASIPQRNQEPHLICYCREPKNESDLVQCSNEFCLIGWFHASCCLENASLLSDRRFFCEFCSDRAPEFESAISRQGSEEISSPDGTLALTPDETHSDHDIEIADIQEAMPGRMSSPLRGGFTPINSDRQSEHSFPSSINLDGFVDTKLRPFVNYRTSIPLDADITSIEDIAPFISYENFPSILTGLREEDIISFEAWRCALPASRLVGDPRLRSIVAMQEAPRVPREDLQKLARRWVDRLVYRKGKTLETRLSGWIGRKPLDGDRS